MKKALVLGVMAFFAFNFIAIQNVNAQGPDKAAVQPTKPTVSAQPNTVKGDDPKRAEMTNVNSQTTVDDRVPATTTKKAGAKLTTTIKEGNAAVQTGNAVNGEVKPIKMEEEKDVKHQTTLGTHRINDRNTATSRKVGKTTLKTDPKTNNLKLIPKDIKSEKSDAAKAEKNANKDVNIK